jgi:hypothetical protein
VYIAFLGLLAEEMEELAKTPLRELEREEYTRMLELNL